MRRTLGNNYANIIPMLSVVHQQRVRKGLEGRLGTRLQLCIHWNIYCKHFSCVVKMMMKVITYLICIGGLSYYIPSDEMRVDVLYAQLKYVI